MDTAQNSKTDTGTGATTVATLVRKATETYDGPAFKFNEGMGWKEISYSELGEWVSAVAKGLIDLGLEKGDTVAIFSDTRPSWVVADLAGAWAGLVVATVYHTSSADEAYHILENSEAKLVFCESTEELEKVKEAREKLEGLEHAVLFDGEADGALTLDELRDRGAEAGDEALEERAGQVKPDDLFTLVYTSGTTGPAKGCRLTHGNVQASLEAFRDAVDLGEDPVFYLFLPLAHVLSRLVELVALDAGAMLGFWQQDKDKLLEDLKWIKPTHFAAVPRIFEKIYNKAAGEAEGGIKGKIFEKAMEAGREAREKERQGESLGPVLKAEYELANHQIFGKVRELFGGRMRLAVTGAAPVAKEMLEFFDACGLLVLEGYGLTETGGIATANTPDKFRFGTQGHALGQIEVRIAEKEEGEEDDEEEEGQDPGGEVLVKGPNIFRGYHKMDEETKEVLDDDGWFRTEDVGSLDEDGFLTITGRTKDIVVTSSGKNIPAARIENEISDHRWISQAVVYGDDKKYLVALITIDDDERSALAEQAGVDDDAEEMASSEAVHEEIQKVIDEANENFARIEQVKKFAILERDFTQDEGELTPTLKVKRKVVYDNHRDRFEALYEED